MSNFSSLYDAIVLRLETVLPNHMRLTNPYNVDQNPEGLLRQGWGLGLGSGSNTNRELSCRISIQRDFNIVLSRKFYAKESDVQNKADVEKQLFEDLILIVRDFCDNSALPGALGIVNYSSDGGIEQVFGEKDNYLVLRTVFTVEHLETI
jgi:hypothetical protein